MFAFETGLLSFALMCAAIVAESHEIHLQPFRPLFINFACRRSGNCVIASFLSTRKTRIVHHTHGKPDFKADLPAVPRSLEH